MKVSKVNQYSVFLINEAGALEKFANLLCGAGLDISGLSSDVKYEAAVVKFVLSEDDKASHEVLSLMTKGGYTAIRTEGLCVEVDSKPGVMAKLGAGLSKRGINITTIFGSAFKGSSSKIFLVVNDIDKAIKALNEELNS